MRDEMKQSRGCGFVKYSQREMALAAINALNGTYTMRGCDQPLTVRFADPKRPRPGESRGGPLFGGPGLGPRFSAPGNRPPPDHGQPLHGAIPPNSWPPVSPQNLGPPSHAGNHGFANQFSGQHRDMASSTPGPIGGLPGNTDGSVPGPTLSSAPTSQLGLPPQVPPYGSKISPAQRPLQSPQHLPTSMQLQPLNATSFSNAQNLPGSNMQPGQTQTPHSGGQTPYSQAAPSQQLPGRNGQLSVPQNQVLHNATTAPGQAPGMANQQPPPGQQLQHHQSPSQLAQMLSQQKQTLQATFHSSQQALNQLQQQVQQLQPSNQNLTAHQSPLATRQQSPWAGMLSHTAASTPSVQPAGDLATTTASPAVPAVAPAIAPVNCNWTEHMSPDGYKYYYNSLTGESKWEKPEELTLFEQQQQQQQKPSTQHPQVQSHSLGPSSQQASQMQAQFQVQQQAHLHNQNKPMQQPSQTSYQVPGLQAKQGTKEHGYLQIPAGIGPVNDPARYQQGVQSSQEWMWKNKHSGT
ncbi:hypothetical protein CDL12_08101 [Handroanthus impetiginosus]|uniref:Flowering time control protein FCA n=1 Tax=Handroanthus impetiginosus TaxID=429701 RepID=A0A2G9HNU6_9LAMI|nr:hypothetical protein CDL12_08101 [Handroanthus impetiginosus]